MKFRLTSSIVFSTIGFALLGIHYFSRLWPILPLSIAIGAVALIIASYKLGASNAWLGGACGLMFAHTSIALLYPETLTNIDPDGYAMWVNQVLNSGDVTQAETRTYSTLPMFLLLISAVSLVGELFPRNAFIAIPIFISIIVPLFTAWFTSRLTGCSKNDWPAVPAALLTTVATMNVAFGHQPIAMTIGYLLLLLASITSTRFYLTQNKADIVMFTVLVVGITLAHRFTILLLALVVSTQAIYYTASGSSTRISRDLFLLPTIGFAFLALQWAFITTALNRTVYQILDLFAETGTQIAVDQLATGSSRPVIESRVLGIVARRVHGIVLIPLAGLAWLHFALGRQNDSQSRIGLTLAIGAVVGAFLPLSIVYPDELNFTRSIVIAEPVLIGLATGAGWVLWTKAEQQSIQIQQVARYTILLLGLLIVVAQIGSAPIAADHPADYRGYLESDEVSAKMWGHAYAGSNISADPFFAHEKPRPHAHVDSQGEIKQEYSSRYGPILNLFTNRSIISSCPRAVLYRDLRVYRSPRAQVLQWNPETTLDTAYNRQYDGGKVQFFSDPRCL